MHGILFLFLMASIVCPSHSLTARISRDEMDGMLKMMGDPTEICWEDDCYPERECDWCKDRGCCKGRDKDIRIVINNTNINTLDCNGGGSGVVPTFSCPTGSQMVMASSSSQSSCDASIPSMPNTALLGYLIRATWTSAQSQSQPQSASGIISCGPTTPIMNVRPGSTCEFGDSCNSVTDLFMACDTLTLSTQGNAGGCTIQACVSQL